MTGNGSSETDTTEADALEADVAGPDAAGRASGSVALFAGPGEMWARCRALDWAATPLGPVTGWPAALGTAVRLMLASPVPTSLWVGDEYTLLYNDAYARLIGANHPQALGRPGAAAWASAWPTFAPRFDAIRAGGAPDYADEAFIPAPRLPGGGVEDAWFTYGLSALTDEDGRCLAVYNVAIEVTGRVLAERQRAAARAALAAERERLTDIVRMAPAFMAVLRGPDHVIELTNAGYETLVGARDVRGRPVTEALPEAAAQGFVALLDRVLATGEPFVGREVPYQRPDATGAEDLRYVDFVYQALTEPDGSRSGVFVHGVDVTGQVRGRHEVERLLAEAEHARGEATAANETKSVFLATMSHELRTPVNAVIGYAQMLDMGLAGPLTERQRGYLERLARSSHHLLGLVNDVLDLTKIEAGETRVAHEDGMTGPAVAAALDVVAPTAAKRGVRLVDGRPDDADVPFVGDEDRVRQVAVNLLSNAVKFTPAGGTVTVTCDTVRATPPSAAHLRGQGPWALVRVEDTGVGIPPEEQGRIFEPFHQVEAGHTRVAGGTGLGLAISRQLARLMGGDLSVESAPGVGSVFTLWLPAARHAAGQLDETAAARSVRAERDLTRLETPGLGEVGALLHESVREVIGAYTDRLRADPGIPRGSAMTRIQLEDHAISFLADLAQSLVIVGEAGPESVELLADGSEIQRAIGHAHGARRHAQGWDEAALRCDQQIFREEVERAVRARLKPGSADVNDAVHVLLGLIDRGQKIAVRAWRRAQHAAH